MEMPEFIELTRATLARLAPRLTEGRPSYIQSSEGAGVWDIAVYDLTELLAEQQIPVAPDDREDLRSLLTYLGQPTENVDRLNVESPLAN